MFKRLNQALNNVSNDKQYNTILVILVLIMFLSFLISSSFLFITGSILAFVEVLLIIKAYKELKNEDKKSK